MKRALCSALLLACGPRVGIDDTGGDSTSSDASTSASAPTGDPTSVTDTTTATTVSTSATTDPTTTTTPTTTTVTDTVADSSDSDPDGGITFITGADAGPGCGIFCDVFAQDCPLGWKCMPWSCDVDPMWFTHACRELDPDPVELGSACTTQDSPYSGLDDCDAVAMCWNVDAATLVGECVAFCDGFDGNAFCDEDPSRACFLGLGGIVPVCVPRCQPLATTCAADEECIHNIDNDAEPSFVCAPNETVGGPNYGDDCSDGGLCATGLACRGAAHVPGCATDRCCTTLGQLSAPPVCPDAAQTCLPLYADGNAPTGYEDLCFCGVEA